MLQFCASPESPGVTSLTPFLDSHVPITQVPTTRLDTILGALHVRNVDYLKVDAEGHDLFVLKTYPFEQPLPRVVLGEFEDRKTLPLGYDMAEMARFLVDAGYRVIVSEWYPIKRYGQAHRWRRFARFPFALPNSNVWGNLIAFREDDEIVEARPEVFRVA